MNVSKLTLSCRWLSSASFSVASSSIPSPCALSPDTEISNIQTGIKVWSAPRAPLRSGCRRASMVRDAAAEHSASMPCHCWRIHTAEQTGKTIQCSQLVDRRVQPFKGTLRSNRRGKRSGGRLRCPCGRNTKSAELKLLSHWDGTLMILQFSVWSSSKQETDTVLGRYKSPFCKTSRSKHPLWKMRPWCWQ